MKEKDSPLNIFHSAAKKKGPPPPEKKAEPAPPQEKATKPHVPKKGVDPEIKEMLDRIDEMRKDLENQIEFISRQSGWSKEKLYAFTNDPKNFSPEQWEVVQNENKLIVEKVWAAIGPAVNVKPPDTGKKPYTPPTPKDPSQKDRKGKFIGSRRKWIPTK